MDDLVRERELDDGKRQKQAETGRGWEAAETPRQDHLYRVVTMQGRSLGWSNFEKGITPYLAGMGFRLIWDLRQRTRRITLSQGPTDVCQQRLL